MKLPIKSEYPLKGRGNKRIEFNFDRRTNQDKEKSEFYDKLPQAHKTEVSNGRGTGGWFSSWSKYISLEAYSEWKKIELKK